MMLVVMDVLCFSISFYHNFDSIFGKILEDKNLLSLFLFNEQEEINLLVYLRKWKEWRAT